MTETIKLGERTITYELIRKKVKNINLHVKADGRIIISANNRVSKKYIEDFLVRKADWIEKNIKKFENMEAKHFSTLKPDNGQSIRLLGADYPVQVVEADENRIEFNNNRIRIYTRYPNDSHRLELLWNKWFSVLLKEVFELAVKKVYPGFVPYQVPMPLIKLRKMKTRWGSCSVYGGVITLNTALIHAPVECIEYVAAHELTHFLHPDHSSRFYHRLSGIMPDYKERKILLERQGIHY